METTPQEWRNYIEESLESVDPDMASPEAVELLLGTASRESRLGKFGNSVQKHGIGPFQIIRSTEKDIWDNYLKYRPELAKKITEATGVSGPNPQALVDNLPYAALMARLVYKRVPEALPAANDLAGQAKYWKKYYNTELGKGTPEGYIMSYRQDIGQRSRQDFDANRSAEMISGPEEISDSQRPQYVENIVDSYRPRIVDEMIDAKKTMTPTDSDVIATTAGMIGLEAVPALIGALVKRFGGQTIARAVQSIARQSTRQIPKATPKPAAPQPTAAQNQLREAFQAAISRGGTPLENPRRMVEIPQEKTFGRRSGTMREELARAIREIDLEKPVVNRKLLQRTGDRPKTWQEILNLPGE